VNLLAQLDAKTFWNAPSDSAELKVKLVLSLLVGFGLVVGLMFTPAQARKYIVFAATFISGLFYVLFWLWPAPIHRQKGEGPRGTIEAASFWISDAQSVVASLTNVIAGFLLGLGIYSLLRVHGTRILKGHKDTFFSAVLLICMVAMFLFGIIDFAQHQDPKNFGLADEKNWGFINYGKDLLFDGLLQNMDAAMFSIVAFFIMSAAYRAFRARSVEATILLVTALIVMFSLMGVVVFMDGQFIDNNFKGSPIAASLRISDITAWLLKNVQTTAIRGIDFGVGLGLMAMALRIWLNLEKTGGNS